MNSVGILTGGGMGRLLAHWILTGQPDVDVTGFNIDRLHRYQSNSEYRATRTVESLGMVFQCHYPGKSMTTARNAKISPIHQRLQQHGAYFKDVSGWEGADWYAPAGVEPKIEKLSWGRQNWFDYWRAEHEAARNDVIVMDMSFMSKFFVQGRDSGRLLNQLSANDVDGAAGVITYTQWLNEHGRLEADLTVTKLDDDRYWVVATDTAHRHVETRMRRHFGDHHAIVTDVTSGYAQLNVQGPRSRELLQSITSADLSSTAFRFGQRDIDIRFARALCVRITYLGELGYELYVPSSKRSTCMTDRRCRRGFRSSARRPEGARQPTDGEGLPRLRSRHRQHRFGARSRARLRGGSRQAGRLHRSRRGCRAQGRRAIDTSSRASARRRSRTADVPR